MATNERQNNHMKLGGQSESLVSECSDLQQGWTQLTPSIAAGIFKVFQFAAGFFQPLKSIDVSKTASIATSVSKVSQFTILCHLQPHREASKLVISRAGSFHAAGSEMVLVYAVAT